MTTVVLHPRELRGADRRPRRRDGDPAGHRRRGARRPGADMTGYTSPWETDELALLRDTAREFFTREGMPQLEKWERQRHVDRAFWLRAGELGLLCPMVPEEYGGPGGTFLHHLAITEAQGWTIDKGWGNSVHSGIVADYVLAYGSEEQK